MEKIALPASEKKKESLLHGQGGWGWVPYYADSVFAGPCNVLSSKRQKKKIPTNFHWGEAVKIIISNI